MEKQKLKEKITKRSSSGITLIALAITIIVLLILAGVVIAMLTGENGIFGNVDKTLFYNKMSELEEKKNLEKMSGIINQFATGETEQTNQMVNEENRIKNIENIKELDSTLKAEIIFVRENLGGGGTKYTTKQIWDNNLYRSQEIYEGEDTTEIEGLSKDLYYIGKDIAGEEKGYIYDASTDTCYKIGNTKIGDYTVHSLTYANFVIDGKFTDNANRVNMEAEIGTASDGTKYYEPDFNKFSYRASVVYYSSDFSEIKYVSIEEYLKNGKAKKIEEGGTYTFADYTSKEGADRIWGNVRCTANGLESWWVWIPRYAFKVDGANNKIEVIFVDTNNKQFDGSELPEGYHIHEAFNQGDGLKGIWFSKYDPSSYEFNPVDTSDAPMPDYSKFNPATTKLVYYTANGAESTEESFSTNPPKQINKNGKTYYLYNYAEHVWANVKCENNELESYWVWIPRYAFKISDNKIKVILVDDKNVPIDTRTYGNTIPDGYNLHEAFNQDDGLSGIWFSKYDPTRVETEE